MNKRTVHTAVKDHHRSIKLKSTYSSNSHPILQLQHTLGNKVVSGLIQRSKIKPTSPGREERRNDLQAMDIAGLSDELGIERRRNDVQDMDLLTIKKKLSLE